jgi:hypothetical protein
LIAKLQQGETPQNMDIYKLGVDGILLHKKKKFEPNVQDLKRIILHEIHATTIKMYQTDVKRKILEVENIDL